MHQIENFLAESLQKRKDLALYRILKTTENMVDFCSNDYLGFAKTGILVEGIKQELAQLEQSHNQWVGATGSRLLAGNYAYTENLESTIADFHGAEAGLIFNSGYDANVGVLASVPQKGDFLITDEYIHASMIDGIRLSTAQYVRYRHNDLQHLEQLLQKYQQDEQVERIIVVTESIFSMDGDETDLAALAQLKQRFAKTMLYVDEAHAIGVRGEQGLGCAEQYGVLDQIDFLVGTFGKAIASVGGYIICDSIIRDYLINKMRPLIFSTALPPISMAWSDFIFNKVLNMHQQRHHLAEISQYLQQSVITKGFSSPSSSHIIPIIVGESQAAIEKVCYVQQQGFYAMPVRPPTVPQNSSRLRISLTSMVQKAELEKLVECL